MIECRRYILHITKLWGALRICPLTLLWAIFFRTNIPALWKNRFLEVLGEIYSEAPWHGSKAARPAFQRFAANSKKVDIFTTEELNRLFVPENFASELYYLFFLLCLSGGLRLGEARGVRVKQIVFDRKVLIVDGFCKSDGTRTVYNKKGSPENPKFRVVYLPDLTLGKLADWIKSKSLEPDDYCFTLEKGRPICKETLERFFYMALQTAGFIPRPEPIGRNKYGNGRQKQIRAKLKPPDGRKLVPHSLRYTFVSRMRRELSAVELLPMTGHANIDNVDYYNRKSLDLILAGLPKTGAAAVNTLFA
jgi:integrase